MCYRTFLFDFHLKTHWYTYYTYAYLGIYLFVSRLVDQPICTTFPYIIIAEKKCIYACVRACVFVCVCSIAVKNCISDLIMFSLLQFSHIAYSCLFDYSQHFFPLFFAVAAIVIIISRDLRLTSERDAVCAHFAAFFKFAEKQLCLCYATQCREKKRGKECLEMRSRKKGKFNYVWKNMNFTFIAFFHFNAYQLSFILSHTLLINKQCVWVPCF